AATASARSGERRPRSGGAARRGPRDGAVRGAALARSAGHSLLHAQPQPRDADDRQRAGEVAAATVLLISMAMVMEPTPPGTGVIHEARSLAASNSTSPESFP